MKNLFSPPPMYPYENPEPYQRQSSKTIPAEPPTGTVRELYRHADGSLPLQIENRYRKTISDIIIGVMNEFHRGAVRLHILHHAAHEAVHGAWMAEELARHGYKISPGSLYPTLHKMEIEGLIRSYSQVVKGRTLRSYLLTAKGRRELTTAKKQLRELAIEILGDEAR